MKNSRTPDRIEYNRPSQVLAAIPTMPTSSLWNHLPALLTENGRKGDTDLGEGIPAGTGPKQWEAIPSPIRILESYEARPLTHFTFRNLASGITKSADAEVKEANR